jgi:tetratricopeptide (TPR) repeat protein
MSEHTEHTESTQPNKPLDGNGTQPNPVYQVDDTQPVKAVKKTPRWRSVLTGILAFLLLLGLGGFGGYSSAIGARKSAEKSILSQQLAEQYSYALVDIEFGRFENARQRLEFIIKNDPGFPGAQEKLTEVLVLSSIPTPEPTPTISPTPDFSGAENAFARAQELIRAQDWPAAMEALDSVRKLDPTFRTAQVDGMYYFALRNYGYSLITNQGNLEGGIYHLTLAERFGPLDNSSKGLRDAARVYITGASFWELNWEQALFYFTQVGAGWPSLWDGTMTASQRLHIAYMRYGDELFQRGDYCGATEMYQNATAINALDATAARNANEAYLICFPPTATPEPFLPTPTLEGAPTEETPTPEPDP